MKHMLTVQLLSSNENTIKVLQQFFKQQIQHKEIISDFHMKGRYSMYPLAS